MTPDYFIFGLGAQQHLPSIHGNAINLSDHQKYVALPGVHQSCVESNGIFEADLIRWCFQFGDKSKVFLDVGAHAGTYSICLAHLFKEVHSFEPSKYPFMGLCAGVLMSKLDNVCVHNYALSNKDMVGKGNLFIDSLDGGSASLMIKNQVICTETVYIDTLDSYQIDDIGFVKIDVEGSEFDVISGGLETLSRSGWPKILFESNVKDERLWALLISLGYRIIDIHGIPNMFIAEQ